jgi:hypothetical protein
MAEVVYLLCALTSLACAGLLLRSYWHSRLQLTFWTSVGFALLAANNVLLFVDLVIVPRALDLSVLRNSFALGGVLVLLHALVREATS